MEEIIEESLEADENNEHLYVFDLEMSSLPISGPARETTGHSGKLLLARSSLRPTNQGPAADETSAAAL